MQKKEQKDKVLLIEVLEMNNEGIKRNNKIKMNRQEYSEFFRRLNRACL